MGLLLPRSVVRVLGSMRALEALGILQLLQIHIAIHRSEVQRPTESALQQQALKVPSRQTRAHTHTHEYRVSAGPAVQGMLNIVYFPLSRRPVSVLEWPAGGSWGNQALGLPWASRVSSIWLKPFVLIS